MLILIDFVDISTPYEGEISQSTISTKKLFDDEKHTFKTELFYPPKTTVSFAIISGDISGAK